MKHSMTPMSYELLICEFVSIHVMLLDIRIVCGGIAFILPRNGRQEQPMRENVPKDMITHSRVCRLVCILLPSESLLFSSVYFVFDIFCLSG